MDERNTSFLRTRSVSHVYKTGTMNINVLNDISFSVKKGEFVSILGPSGCGKTTLLNIIGGLEQPTNGEIEIDNVNIASIRASELSDYRKKKVAFIFQFYNLFPQLTAIENVRAGIEILGINKQESKERAMNYLEMVGLIQKKDRFPSHLSGGEQQRVAIARALAKGAPLILADEPTGNLDQKSGQIVIDLFTNIHHTTQTSIIMITHDQNLAKRADKIISMLDGKIVEEKLPVTV